MYGGSGVGAIRRHHHGAPLIPPPFDTGNLIWAFDPSATGASQFLAGPTGTPSGAVQNIGAPSYYTFANATDTINFGDALDNVWTSASLGFTLYACASPAASQLLGGTVSVLSKLGSGSNLEWQFYLSGNQFWFATYYGGTSANSCAYKSPTSVFVGGTRYVMAVTFNPTVGQISRGGLWLNAVGSGNGSVVTGVDGTMADTTGTLNIGASGDGSSSGCRVIGPCYAYQGVHNSTVIGQITTWLQNTKGWK